MSGLRPAVGKLAYYRGSWVNGPPGEPMTFWYEVDHEGNVLRMIDIFADGIVVKDDIGRYPSRASDFGFGTLIGEDFYRLQWGWPTSDDSDELVMLDASAIEFTAVWSATA